MGRTVLWTSITVLFFSLFQAAILSNLTFLPVMPDLVMLVIVYVSFMNASVTGATTGFISGLFLDFLSAAPIGLNAFTKTVTGFVAGKFSGSFNMSKVFIPALMGCAATILKALVTWLLSLFFGPEILVYRLLGSLFWLELLANAVMAPVVFAILGLFPSLFAGQQRPEE
jgi:rod shape-determining protein MreD